MLVLASDGNKIKVFMANWCNFLALFPAGRDGKREDMNESDWVNNRCSFLSATIRLIHTDSKYSGEIIRVLSRRLCSKKHCALKTCAHTSEPRAAHCIHDPLRSWAGW